MTFSSVFRGIRWSSMRIASFKVSRFLERCLQRSCNSEIKIAWYQGRARAPRNIVSHGNWGLGKHFQPYLHWYTCCEPNLHRVINRSQSPVKIEHSPHRFFRAGSNIFWSTLRTDCLSVFERDIQKPSLMTLRTILWHSPRPISRAFYSRYDRFLIRICSAKRNDKPRAERAPNSRDIVFCYENTLIHVSIMLLSTSWLLQKHFCNINS